MENINAEVFTLRNQRKQIKDLTEKLKAVLGQFDKLENELLKAQYKHGLMIAFDEIGYTEESYKKRINELFAIKQNYHHLWSETQELTRSMEKHYSSEEGLMKDLMEKIQSLTPDNINDIKGIQQQKKVKKEHYFKDMTNVKKEIDDLKKVIEDLEGMKLYVSGKSPRAYYNKETKDYNAIIDKIDHEKEKLEQFKKVKNSNMTKTTEAIIRSYEQDKDKIVKKTVSAIDETLASLQDKITNREKIADKYFKIKSLRFLVQGAPRAGKFSLIHSLDPYSALQRKGNFMVVNSPDYVFSAFKGLLVWVQDEDKSKKTGQIYTLPTFEEKFEEFKERVKVKIELTCATGYVDSEIFPKIIDGMKCEGLIYIYDSTDNLAFEDSKDLFKSTSDYLHLENEQNILILANKSDLNQNSNSELIKNAKKISIKSNPLEVNEIFTDYINNIIFNSTEIKELIELNVD
ncbi:hypothetical protein NEF87_005041 [Candidatus Lokiarchaeum ossiferum]|uniref:Small GTP-binding domain protein n=1 Tax=Candidatus Lokiarchaeum ossiferum TaxID=2951803 RepID=A0ABY6HZK9_9ARCH|nr:hypothetical protein NEF87_005041 [Candidatus Lokiarchaeum sp. B-35]